MNHISKIVIMALLVVTVALGTVIPNIKARPKLVGDEPLTVQYGVPYLGESRGPGDQIGTTWYDYQANGSFGQRIMIDDYTQAHINWMKMDAAGNLRYCAWNARFSDGTYFGETQAAPSWSGYVQLDVSRDANPDMQRSMIVYHYEALSWIDFDAGNLYGSWPNDPKTPNDVDWEWPYATIASNGNVIMATGDYGVEGRHHFYVTTDEGTNWNYLGVIGGDSCLCLSQFVRSSRNPGSHKVVHAWTQSIGLEYAGYLISQMADNVYYMLSTDDGATWGSPVRLTNYTPPITMTNGDSTPWAFCDVNAVFDNNDNLHIAWGVHLGWVQSDTLYYGDRAKIFHWDEVSNTVSTVNSPSTYYPEPGGWWLQRSVGIPSGEAGAWRIPADHPQLVVDPNTDTLYCLWHGNDDTTDVSAAGYINGEIYAAKSGDGGLTWTPYSNLTNTRTPGGASGACDDEDYMTACPLIAYDATVGSDAIFITYIEDKDAGSYPHNEGVATENPVRCYVFDKHLVGIAEHKPETISRLSLNITPNPLTTRSQISYTLSIDSRVSLRLYDAAGRLTKTIVNTHKPAGKYTVNFSSAELANGTYFLLLETDNTRLSRSLVIVH